MKTLLLSALTIASLLSGTLAGVRADERREEWREHPRIVRAVHELEEAIKYMQAAPRDFGGHKAAALAASREAVRQLRLAINYRVEDEGHHER
jgi:hypothetical protein